MLTSILWSAILIIVSYGLGMYFGMKVEKINEQERQEDEEKREKLRERNRKR
jgi:hypothetical protein